MSIPVDVTNIKGLRPTEASQPVLSLVIPLFNEAANLGHLFDRVKAVLDRIGLSYEIVCVDDGSSDDTVARLVDQHRADPRIKVVELSRNFGKELALTAGLRHAAGQAVVMIDADLQHPPEMVEQMVAEWRRGWEMVIAVRRSRDTESALKRINARLFYWLFTRISETKIRPDAGDFRLLDRKVVDVLNRMPEHIRFMKGLYSWVGFRQTVLPYDVTPRMEGKSKWSPLKLWGLALDGLTSFTTVPLQVWTLVGTVTATLGLGYGLFLILKTIILGIDVPGYASLMVAVLFFGGMQMITLGVIGEYLGRVFKEVKNRPLYVVRNAYGCADQAEAAPAANLTADT